MLYCSILFYIDITLYYIMLYCIVLYYIILYYIVLYYMMLLYTNYYIILILYTNMYMCISLSLYIYICIYVCMYVCIYIYIYVRTHILLLHYISYILEALHDCGLRCTSKTLHWVLDELSNGASRTDMYIYIYIM